MGHHQTQLLSTPTPNSFSLHHSTLPPCKNVRGNLLPTCRVLFLDVRSIFFVLASVYRTLKGVGNSTSFFTCIFSVSRWSFCVFLSSVEHMDIWGVEKRNVTSICNSLHFRSEVDRSVTSASLDKWSFDFEEVAILFFMSVPTRVWVFLTC